MKQCKRELLVIGFILFFVNNIFGSFSWTQMADFGGGIRDAAFGFSIGNYGYAGTGRNPSDNNDFWRYDPTTNSWTQMSNYPGLGRYGLFGFSIGNYGYAGTGWTGVGGGGLQYKDFYQYDPSTNSWNQKADFGGAPRYSAVGFSIGNKGYVGLGYQPIKNDFWEYDPIGNSWSQKANFPYPRIGSVAFAIGNKGYVGTGYDIPAASYSDFYEFDPVANSWTQKSNVPGMSRRAPVGFGIGNYGYVGMGYSDTTYLTDFYQYDPIADNWATIASIGGIPRYWSFAFAIDNYGYVGVGSFAGVASPIRTADFWRLADCDGSPLEVSILPNQHHNIQMIVKPILRNGLILEYDLEGERNVTFNFYNSLGQLIITANLLPNSTYMNLPILLSNEIYFYSVVNSRQILSNGKVLVY